MKNSFIHNFIKHKKAILLTFILQTFLCCAVAQNYDSLLTVPLKDLLKLKVTGVSKFEETQLKAPANVIVITKEQIRENGYQDLSDVLKNVQGIDIVDYARGYGEFYTLNGIEGNDRFLVLIDGQKINPVSGTFLSVGNSISISYAERIEIILGPNSVMYGADAFSGIINIVSKPTNVEPQLSFKSDYGTLNTLNAELNATLKTKKGLNFIAHARFFKSDGPNFIGRDSIYDIIKEYPAPLNNNFEQPINDHSIFLRGSYKNLSLTYFRQRFDEGNAFGQQTQSVIYNKECKWAVNNNIVGLSYINDFDSLSRLTVNIAFINHQQDTETQFFKWERGAILQRSFNQYMTGVDNTHRSVLTYSRKFNKWLKMVYGAEFEYTQSIPPYANDQVFGHSVRFAGNEAKRIRNELTIRENRYAGLAQITFSPSSKLDFILGGRFDYSSRYKETFNPRMSLIYSVNDKTSVKLLFGTAFQAPSLFYQYEQWGSITAVMLSVQEINSFDPAWKLYNQEVQNYEINVSRRITNNLVIHLAGYYNYLTNIIERTTFTDLAYNKYFSKPDSAVYSLGFRNENIGKQMIYGFNSKAELRLKTNFYAYLNYSFIEASSEKNGQIENIPRIASHKLWFGFTYGNLLKYITISSRMKWIGEINNRNPKAYPSGKQAGYFNADMNINISNFSKHINFYIRLENFLNLEYEHSGLLDQILYLPSIPQPKFVGRIGFEVIIN